MDINDLFEGIAEAPACASHADRFRQYQAEMVEQEQALNNPNPA